MQANMTRTVYRMLSAKCAALPVETLVNPNHVFLRLMNLYISWMDIEIVAGGC